MTEKRQMKRVAAFGLPAEPVGEGPEVLRVLNPVADPHDEGFDLAPRLETLNGKRVAFFWNAKPGGDVALRRIEEQLIGRFPDMVPIRLHYEHHKGGGTIPLDSVLPSQPQAVIASTAD